jgi:hypothetical protein
LRIARVALIAIATLAAAPAASARADANPADQPPFGGESIPPLVAPASPDRPPPGFRLSARQAIAIAEGTDEVRGELSGRSLTPRARTSGEDRWQIDLFDENGVDRAQVVIDDPMGRVLEAWTGAQVDTKLARGYHGAVAGDVNEWWFWLPLCVLFLVPFVDPRRLLRLLHLDLLALLGFSGSLFFFNKAEIGLSVALVYPVLAYIFIRALVAGFRPSESRERLLPFFRREVLLVGAVLLALLHGGYAMDRDAGKVIDVGLAGVIGADRLVKGEDVYSEDFSQGLPRNGDVRGDVYGPVNYLAYVPFEQAFPWSGKWDEVYAARAAALGFDLLTAVALFFLGRRLRRGRDGRPSEEGRNLGAALAFAWLAYPFTMYTLGSSFNDSLVALLLVCCLLVLASPPGRGAMSALAGLTKFGPLAVAPLLAAGTGERRPRQLIAFAIAFVAVAALVTIPLIPHGGLSEIYDRSLGYQASRGSPFSVWGQAPSLGALHTLSKVFAVGLAVALFFLPRRRSPIQVAALAAAVIIAVQVTANHWFYPYAVWFAPLVLVALFAQQRGPEPRVSRNQAGALPAGTGHSPG